MKILTEIHRASGININGKTVHRIAARGVIQRGNKLLMVYSANVGDYKFPGGGVNVGETHEQALSRELREECGAGLLRMDGKLGAIIEYNFPKEKDFDAFKMTSYYYFCSIEDGLYEQRLDGYEKDLGFEPAWINIEQAIQKNKLLLKLGNPPEWLQREIFTLEYLMLYFAHGN